MFIATRAGEVIFKLRRSRLSSALPQLHLPSRPTWFSAWTRKAEAGTASP